MPAVDNSRWDFVITNMSGSTSIGGTGRIPNAQQRTFSYHLNAARQATCVVNIDTPVANFVLTNDCLLKVYRRTKVSNTPQLLMVGDVIHVEEAGQGDTAVLTIVASDPWFRLQRRFIGMGVDSIGRGIGYTDGTALAMKDYSVLAKNVLVNANAAFNSGIQTGTIVNTGTNGYIGPVYAQNAGDLLQQFCSMLGGPELEMQPLEPSGLMPGTIIAQMNVLAAIGSLRSNCAFEYGTGKMNVQSYDRLINKDGYANQIYVPPQGFPSTPGAGDSMVIAQDTARQNAVGLYQDVIQSDVASQTLRTALANQYLAVRKVQRNQITFTPTVNNPMDYGVDYGVGDVVTARAMVSGSYRYNGTARVYGVDFSIDEQDVENVSLTLIPGG